MGHCTPSSAPSGSPRPPRTTRVMCTRPPSPKVKVVVVPPLLLLLPPRAPPDLWKKGSFRKRPPVAAALRGPANMELKGSSPKASLNGSRPPKNVLKRSKGSVW